MIWGISPAKGFLKTTLKSIKATEPVLLPLRSFIDSWKTLVDTALYSRYVLYSMQWDHCESWLEIKS
jgi:hypothetical protein